MVIKMIIDMHTHAFPDRIYERTIQILEQNIYENSNKEFHAIGSGNVSGLRASMAADGIDFSLVLPIATAPKQTDNINRFAAQINGTDGVFSFGSLHPAQNDIEGILEQIAEAGLLGIKLHPEYQQFYVDSPEAIRIFKKCEQLGLYCMLHTGADHGCPPPIHCSPERLAHILDYVCGDHIIAAHMGGWHMWEEAQKYIIGSPMLIDTCFSLHLMPCEQALQMIRAHGADKVMVGSDWPWYSQKKSVEHVMELNLSDKEKALICGENARRILNL